MHTKYKVIPATDTPSQITEHNCDLPERPTYQQIRTVVEPYLKVARPEARLEHVSVLGDDGERADMFVDDVGALSGLPINLEATRRYHRASIERCEEQVDGIIPNAPRIHGCAVLFARRIWF
jgi:hypothetical protein